MGVRVDPTQTPQNGSNPPANDVDVKTDDGGGGGSSFQATVYAEFNPAVLTPSNVSSPGLVIANYNNGMSVVRWSNVTVQNSGTSFTFTSICARRGNNIYKCWADNLDTGETSTKVDLSIPCAGPANMEADS